MIRPEKRISIEESRKILNKNGLNYTDEEIIIIRDFLYDLAKIDYEHFMRKEAKLKDTD